MHPEQVKDPQSGGDQRGSKIRRQLAALPWIAILHGDACRLPDPAGGTRKRGHRVPSFPKTPRNQVQEGRNAQTLVQKVDHLFEAESSLLAKR